MRLALFSQSLFALSLDEAIDATAALEFPAIELACIAPHLDLPDARRDAPRVARRIRDAGLRVSALSATIASTTAARAASFILLPAADMPTRAIVFSRTNAAPSVKRSVRATVWTRTSSRPAARNSAASASPSPNAWR